MSRMFSLPVLVPLVAGALVLIGCVFNYTRARSRLSVSLLIGAAGRLLIGLLIGATGGSLQVLNAHLSAHDGLVVFIALGAASWAFELLFAVSLLLTLRQGFRSRVAEPAGPA